MRQASNRIVDFDFARKGFTLSELLIVVAIIAVLVAIAIPVFTSQLDKARESVTLANARCAYAAASTEMITSDGCVKSLQQAGCTTPGSWYAGDVAYLALKSSVDAPTNEFAKKVYENMGGKTDDGKGWEAIFILKSGYGVLKMAYHDLETDKIAEYSFDKCASHHGVMGADAGWIVESATAYNAQIQNAAEKSMSWHLTSVSQSNIKWNPR